MLIMKSFANIVSVVILFISLAVYSNDQDPYLKVSSGVAELGKNWNAEVNVKTTDLFIELHELSDRSGVTLISDIAYGEHYLQVLDIVTSEIKSEELLPVVVFFHGGGLVRGNKVLPVSDLLLTNIPTFFAKNNMIGVNANYRLAPEASWPAAPEDVHEILNWIKDNIESYGGDPQSIFLMGNSAGGRVVSSYLFHEPSHLSEGPGVIGALLSSSSFSTNNGETHRNYYSDDLEVREALVPLGLVDSYSGPQIPIFLWSAELDPANIEVGIGEMYAKLCAKYQDCPRFTQFQGHNHISHIMSLNSSYEKIGIELIDFIQSVLD
ncbi:MAG: hypothetical protein CMQ51_03800 [Gammaproteobacteria bacterium]|nr:hypothetical protein [Gammaproteobacteria bacterium]